MATNWPVHRRGAASAALIVVLILALIYSAGARAQAPGGMGSPMPMPMPIALRKIPLGSWSEYRLDDGRQKMTVHVALVSRSAKTAEIETQVNGGLIPGMDHVVVRMSLPLAETAELKPIEQVLQLGASPPMLLPATAVGQNFRKVDPAKRVGVEDIQVTGGKFVRTDHHQEKGSIGETIDFWIAKDVLPFGLVKTVSTPKGGGTPVVMELVGRGTGAKAVITKKPEPFNPGALAAAAGAARQGGAGAGQAAPAGQTPARPVPSPHPGMPPTPLDATKAPPAQNPPAHGK